MSKTLFTFNPCSMPFSQKLVNYCTGLLLDRMHIPSPHRLIKRQNNYGSNGMVGNRQEEISLEQVSNTELCLLMSSWLNLATDV